jgi:hypothetical protein
VLPERLIGVFRLASERTQELSMNDDVFNMSVRKFLKKVGVTSQREIEQSVRDAISSGRLKGNEILPIKVELTLGEIGLAFEIDGELELS